MATNPESKKSVTRLWGMTLLGILLGLIGVIWRLATVTLVDSIVVTLLGMMVFIFGLVFLGIQKAVTNFGKFKAYPLLAVLILLSGLGVVIHAIIRFTINAINAAIMHIPFMNAAEITAWIFIISFILIGSLIARSNLKELGQEVPSWRTRTMPSQAGSEISPVSSSSSTTHDVDTIPVTTQKSSSQGNGYRWPVACVGCGSQDKNTLENHSYTFTHRQQVGVSQRVGNYEYTNWEVTSLPVEVYVCPACKARARQRYWKGLLPFLLVLLGTIAIFIVCLLFVPGGWQMGSGFLMFFAFLATLGWVVFRRNPTRHYHKVRHYGRDNLRFYFTFTSSAYANLFRDANPGKDMTVKESIL